MTKGTPLTHYDFSNQAEVRAKIYGFLGMTYIQTPNQEFVETLLNESFVSFLTSLTLQGKIQQETKDGLEHITKYIEKIKDQTAEKISGDLSVEYTRLFRGVKRFYGPPPPYESVYREGLLMGESTGEVFKEYREAGVRLPDHLRGEPPDYIGFELDFMRSLCNKEAEMWKNHDEKEALRFLDKERRFLNEHLAKWVPAFCDKIISDSNVDFYRGLAKITKAFIFLEQSQIDLILASVKDITTDNPSSSPSTRH